MRRSQLCVAVCAVLFSITTGLAQGPHGPGMGGSMWQDSTMSMGSMMGCGMMMGFLMPRVTNTPDGGVIVVTGNKLQKYDKDFNLRKEITVKIDTTGMQNLLRQSCPRLSDNQMQQPSSQGGSQQESAPQGAQQKSSMQQKQKKK